MMFSDYDVIGRESELIANRRCSDSLGFGKRIYNSFLNPRNPKYKFDFYVPEHIFLRSQSFCEDVQEELKKSFDTSKLAKVLYLDFLEYIRNSNDVHDIYSRLKVRELAPPRINDYNDEKSKDTMFGEIRGFELVTTIISHKDALRGELLLSDMLEIYPEHEFVLENILEIVYFDFVNDYRRFLIKNPIEKVSKYFNRL